MTKAEAYLKVYNDLMKYSMMKGEYDAKYGTLDFESGVYLVMSTIAVYADKGDEFDEIFFQNILKSMRERKKK